MKRTGGRLTIFLLAAFASGGCSGGVYTPLFEGEVNLASPALGLNDGRSVVYPAPSGGQDEPMVEAFGKSWESVEDDYPGYNFNP